MFWGLGGWSRTFCFFNWFCSVIVMKEEYITLELGLRDIIFRWLKLSPALLYIVFRSGGEKNIRTQDLRQQRAATVNSTRKRKKKF